MTKATQIVMGVVGISILVFAAWFFFFRAPAALPTSTNGPAFGTGSNVSTVGTGSGGSDTNNLQPIAGQASTQKIFLVATGPVAGATLVQTLHPTTTMARYVLASNGHIFDLPLDSPGSVPRAVSNTTIPGVVRTLWTEGGEGVVFQYFDSGVLKSVHVSLPPATTTSSTPAPIRIQFLPDNIASIAASPDGTQVAYLLVTARGADGYTAKADGTGSKKLFSLPLTELLLSWPSLNTLLVQTKSAAGVPGMLFSIGVKSGSVVPLLYAAGLTALADNTFSHVVYQKTSAAGDVHPTYVRNVGSGTDIALSFDPFPEKCVWSAAKTDLLYCAAPLQFTQSNYLDLWHQGLGSVAESVLSFSVSTGLSNLAALPGSKDGGVVGAIETFALSSDDRYLVFVAQGNQALWGVRLTQ
ncbi:hypothetical protein HYS79_00680 [Patescibacteria group bacterium]|nr:hypothetical protein [Patescibacteria group bacterium]